MTLWETPAHIVWNGAMALVWLAALVGFVHPRSRPLRVGWRSKALWVLSLCFTVLVRGYSFPLGAISVLIQLRTGWKELEIEGRDHSVLATSCPSATH